MKTKIFTKARGLMMLILATVFTTSAWATSTNASVTISTYATANSWSNNTRYSSVTIDSHITATATWTSGTSVGKYYSASPGTWRFYQSEGGKLVITAGSGYKITSFTITFTNDDNGTLKYYGAGITSNTAVSGLYTGKVELVTGASSGSTGKILVSQIAVTYVDGSTGSTYNLVTDASKLTAGDVLVFGYSTDKVAGFFYNGFMTVSSATISDGVLTSDEALEFTLGGSSGAWTFTNNSKNLRASGSSTLVLDANTTGGTWTIAIGSATSYNATIANVTYSTSKIYYNTSDPRFKNYTSASGYIQIYKKASCATSVTLAHNNPSHGTVSFSPTGPVETCDGSQNVAMTITPSTGYKLTGWSTDGVSPSSTSPAVSTSGSASEAAQNISLTFAEDADGTYTGSATFSQIMVTSLKLRAQQTDQSDKVGSDLTMTCYPKEGQGSGNDPLNHTLNVAFNEVLPSNALDKDYDWSVRVKEKGDDEWTDVTFSSNTLNSNTIINSYNKSTGALTIKNTEGTAEIKITAHDGSGVTAKVTITVSNVAMTDVSVSPTSMEVYAGQKKPVTVTFTPDNATDRSYSAGSSYTYVTIQNKAAATFNIEGKSSVTDASQNETVTVTTTDGSFTATVDVTVNPLPKATFVDIIHNKQDFTYGGADLPASGIIIATVDAGGLTVTTTKKTPTRAADVSKPGSGNTCEQEHLHLVGWIRSDYTKVAAYMAGTGAMPTTSELTGATGYFLANNVDIDLTSHDGKTFYAVWAKLQ